MALDLQQQEENGAWAITVKGEVDLYSSPQLRDAILKGIGGGSSKVVVDLSGVVYMDSSGVATLVEGLKGAGDKKRFALVKPSASVMKVLQLSRLDSVFTIE